MKTVKKKCHPHRHAWLFSGTFGDGKKTEAVGYWRCNCGAEKKRRLTSAERRWVRADHGRLDPSPDRDVHRVWHEVQRAAEAVDWEPAKVDDIMETLAQKHPEDIFFSGCDDSYHSNSSLWFVLHRAPEAWMGVTVIYVPQCSGEPATTFFLYPCHLSGLQNVLAKVRDTQEHAQQAESIARLRRLEERPASLKSPNMAPKEAGK